MATIASKSPLVSNLDSFYTSAVNEGSTSRAVSSSSFARMGEAGSSQQADNGRSKSYENGMPVDQGHGTDNGQETPVALDEDFPEPICGGCKKLIDEESADAGVIHFATQLWHVDCFRCAKCQSLVTTDRDDILLLSDGNPICGQCNYSCQICGLPIMEEAIMTGDDSYHAACFTCRSCQSPIAELVFAKTSQGIYCMKCHNQRVARSRRHADKKKGSSSKPPKRAESSKTLDASPLTTREGGSPSLSASMEGSPLIANEGDGQGSNAKTLEQSASSSSLGPHAKPGAASPAGSIAKRPLNAPPPSLREMRENQSGGHRGATETEPSMSKSTSLKKGEQVQQPSPTVSPQVAFPDGRSNRTEQVTLTSRDSTTGGQNAIGLGVGLGIEKEKKTSMEAEEPVYPLRSRLEPPKIVRPSSGSECEGEGDEDAMTNSVQYKRASRLSIHNGVGLQEAPRLSKSFSFYDPDIVSLMDSIGRFESSDELSLDMPTSKGNLTAKSPVPSEQEEKSKLQTVEEGVQLAEEKEHQSTPRSPELGKKSDSSRSLYQISNKMRESMKQARNGHVSMETNFVESVLEDLDATRERMKTLQRKYDRIRRASQQAAQGFSSAREEYEQEVQARYDAEGEMLSLKRQLHIQASKLTEMTTERKQQENLQRRSQHVKKSIQGMERDLTKLTVERDLTAAEVAELVALQDGRTHSSGGFEEGIKQSLVKRLEAVKERYRLELMELQAERDALLINIEELRHSRDVFAEETVTLNSRNEELNETLALLNRRVEHAEASGSVNDQSRPQLQAPKSAPQSRSNQQNASGFGFGFGKQGRHLAGVQSSYSTTSNNTSTAVDSMTASNHSHSPLSLENGENVALQRYAPIPVTKVEAVPKKFKWKKTPKLTAESAKTAGQQLAPGLQGVMGPSPPVPPKGTSSQSSSYPHGSGQAQHSALSHHLPPSSDQSNNSNGHSNGPLNGEIVVKEHLFQPFSALRPTRCFACQKSMWGQSEVKCSFCHQACHVRCLQSLPTSCNQPYTRSDEASAEYNGPLMFGRSLVQQVQAEGPERVTPFVVEKCIQAVERLGMDYEGIYRKSGGTSQLKVIRQLFENREQFDLEDYNRFNDISAITSVLKNYFRELPEPLLTFELHERFIECAETKSEAGAKEGEMRKLVGELPKEHFDTLRMLISHLHRVQGKAEENRMNSRNLGVVFGPTLMRSGDPSQEFAHMGGKAMTLEFMIDNPQIFD